MTTAPPSATARPSRELPPETTGAFRGKGRPGTNSGRWMRGQQNQHAQPHPPDRHHSPQDQQHHTHSAHRWIQDERSQAHRVASFTHRTADRMRTSRSIRAFRRHLLKVGTQCGNPARRDLCGEPPCLIRSPTRALHSNQMNSCGGFTGAPRRCEVRKKPPCDLFHG